MVGGAAGIGHVHRRGALMDDLATMVCGCFSSNWDRNLVRANEWHITDESRVYKDYKEMAEKEGARADKIDFVCIVTPNDSHYEIAKAFLEQDIHIVCDKPLTYTLEQGEELARIAKERNLLFAVTYTYTGYAMIRQIRELVDRGELGELLYINAEYPQDWLLVGLFSDKSEQAMWRLDPAKSGPSLCTADIGTHLEGLIKMTTGLDPVRVLAKFDTYPRDLPLETNTTILAEYPGGLTATLWASQFAIGRECDIAIRIYGSKGSVEWEQQSAGVLKFTKLNQPTQILSAAREYLYPEARRLSRLPSGHPEGVFEAFGNIYRSFCEHLIARKTGTTPESFTYPTVEDGVVGMKFIKACVESNANNNQWVAL